MSITTTTAAALIKGGKSEFGDTDPLQALMNAELENLGLKRHIQTLERFLSERGLIEEFQDWVAEAEADQDYQNEEVA